MSCGNAGVIDVSQEFAHVTPSFLHQIPANAQAARR
jgi:hypothetical protein